MSLRGFNGCLDVLTHLVNGLKVRYLYTYGHHVSGLTLVFGWSGGTSRKVTFFALASTFLLSLTIVQFLEHAKRR